MKPWLACSQPGFTCKLRQPCRCHLTMRDEGSVVRNRLGLDLVRVIAPSLFESENECPRPGLTLSELPFRNDVRCDRIRVRAQPVVSKAGCLTELTEFRLVLRVQVSLLE